MTMLDLPIDASKLRTVEAGEVIFLEGQAADKVYVILKGHAEVVVSDPSGMPRPISVMNPGELFGEIALLRDDNKRTATVVARDRCELLEIERGVFDARVVHADPLLRFVIDGLTRRLAGVTEKFVSDRKAD